MTNGHQVNSLCKENIMYISVILLISVAVYKVLMQIHGNHFESLSEAAYGVLEGEPHWRAFQNRLLGPYSVYLISMAGISYSLALKIYILLTIILQNIVLFFLLVKIKISHRNALVWVIIYSFLFLLMQHRWLYTWDNIDVIVFTFFAYGMHQSKPLHYFVILFCVGILNRESAIFIALYIVIDAFHFESIKKFYLISNKKLLVGFSLILVGIAYTKSIRDYLFISSPYAVTDKYHELIGNHIYLSNNLYNLFLNNIFSINIINSAFIIGSISYFTYFVRSYVDFQIKSLLMYYIIIINILIFGQINETRMYLILIPFIIFLIVSNSEHKRNLATL